MRRSQQRDRARRVRSWSRRASSTRSIAADDRLGRQRQRIGDLIRHAGGAEHVRRQIEIRQRPLEDDRRAVERRRIGRFDAASLDVLRTAISSSSRSRCVNHSRRPASAGTVQRRAHGGRGAEQIRRRRPLRGPATSCEAARGNRSRAPARCRRCRALRGPAGGRSRSKSATNSPSGSAIQSATVTIDVSERRRRAARASAGRAACARRSAPDARGARFVLAGTSRRESGSARSSRSAPRSPVAAAERLVDQLLEPLDRCDWRRS